MQFVKILDDESRGRLHISIADGRIRWRLDDCQLRRRESYYGDFEVLPSIYFLLRGGYLSRTTLVEEWVDTQGEIGQEDSEPFERLLNLIIAQGSEVVWDDFLLPGLATYFRDSQTKYGIMFDFEREFPQDTYKGRLKRWDGPKWEDEVVE